MKNIKENQISLKLVKILCILKLFCLNIMEKNKLNKFKNKNKNNLLFHFFLPFFFSIFFHSHVPSNFPRTKPSLSVFYIKSKSSFS